MYKITLTMLLLLVVAASSWAFDYKVEVTQDQLQQQISKMMPVTQEKMFVTVTLSDPTLELGIDGNKLGMFSNIAVTVPGGIKGTGRAKVIGNVSYKKETGEFFFYKPTIAQIEVDQIPSEFHSNIKELAQYALNSAVRNKPIFKLSENDPQQKMAKSMLKSVEVKPGKILVTLDVANNSN
jgi:hypothetical protein